MGAGDDRLHGPKARAEQGHVDDRTLPGPLPLEQGGGDPAGQVGPALDVPEGRAG